jgi:hypothetical protein
MEMGIIQNRQLTMPAIMIGRLFLRVWITPLKMWITGEKEPFFVEKAFFFVDKPLEKWWVLVEKIWKNCGLSGPQ